MISREVEVQILRLAHAEHWPVGTIAAQLGVHHDAVERVLRDAGVPRVVPARACLIDPYIAFVREQWARYPRLTASRLFRMCCERGYAGRPSQFRHQVARLRPRPPAEAFLRLRTLPGEQAQVDWALFGTCRIGRAVRPVVGLVIVLSWSRAIFLRFFHAMATELFLRGHVEAFSRWNGCARICLYDNLKSAVLERAGDAIRFNPLLLDFAAHYRFEPRPVAVARGNEKGRVERSIRFIRSDFFVARRWRDLDELNLQADAWCQGEALDRRWPEDPARTVREALAEEQGRLLALPQTTFPIEERREVAVGRTPYVRFDGNDYSVPHTCVRRTLTVRACPAQVRIFEGTDEVARHARSFDRRLQIEDAAHIAALVESKRQARTHRGMDRLTHAVPASRALIERLAERGEPLGGATARLLELLDVYGAQALERALAEVTQRGALHIAAVQQVIERNHAAQGRPPALPLALPDDPRLRGLQVRPHALGSYDALARAPAATPDASVPDAPGSKDATADDDISREGGSADEHDPSV
jgi:transposase